MNVFLSMQLLPAILSIVAGSSDVISFLGLNGLFVSHITGNLVILAVRMVNVGQAPLALILSVPVFILMLGITKLFVFNFEKNEKDTLCPLLLFQFILLLGYFCFCEINFRSLDHHLRFLFAGMMGVSAMAVQNALVQLSLKDAPTTAVMTTNVTRFVLNLVEMYVGKSHKDRSSASYKVQCLWPTMIGFLIGCASGAMLESKIKFGALILPVFFALIALGIGFICKKAMVEVGSKGFKP